MPILVKDYKWRETSTHVFVTVPLKGVKASKADIFTTNDYIKVNFPPFLFEVHLCNSVIEDQCSVAVGNGVIEFRLVKQEEGLWEKLASTTNKKEMAEKREQAVEEAQKSEKKRSEERARKKKEEERFAIKEQMRIEQEERDDIKKQKDDEIKQAMDDLQIWKESTAAHHTTTAATHQSTDTINTDIWTGKTLVHHSMPPPRPSGKISFNFTPRQFSTAARESKMEEEQEWLTKMAAARRIQRPSNESESTANDLNPEFIKDKAIQLFRAGDNQGAINALSRAIELNPNLPSLHANRAAVYLRMGDNVKTVHDCCRALELYFPVVPDNYHLRAKVFARRGAAYANTGDIDLALQDLRSAIELSPDNESLQKDYERLKNKVI